MEQSRKKIRLTLAVALIAATATVFAQKPDAAGDARSSQASRAGRLS